MTSHSDRGSGCLFFSRSLGLSSSVSLMPSRPSGPWRLFVQVPGPLCEYLLWTATICCLLCQPGVQQDLGEHGRCHSASSLLHVRLTWMDGSQGRRVVAAGWIPMRGRGIPGAKDPLKDVAIRATDGLGCLKHPSRCSMAEDRGGH